MHDSDMQEGYKQYFFYVLFKRKWLVIIFSIIGIAGTALCTYLSTPLYKATSKIMVRANVTQEVILFNDLYQQVPRISNVIPANNIIALATSESLARIIVEKFRLDKKLQRQSENPQDFREYFWFFIKKVKDGAKDVIKYPYNIYKKWFRGETPRESPPDYKTLAVDKFLKDMTEIVLVAESDIISLTIWGESPQEAEAISKELTTLVIQKNISLEQSAANYGYDFSQEEVERVRRELSLLEDKLNSFKQKWDVSKIDRQKEIKLNALEDVERNLIAVNADLSSKKARMDEGMHQLNEQKKMLTSLDSYQDLLDENISLSVDINSLMAKKQEYELAKMQIKSDLSELVEKELELTQIERDVGLKEQLFNQLSSKQDKLDVQRVSSLSGIDLSIIDTPRLSNNANPDWPDWYMNLGIGIPASILLAIVLAFLLELTNESFWIGDQIEKRLNIPVLGTIHDMEETRDCRIIKIWTRLSSYFQKNLLSYI